MNIKSMNKRSSLSIFVLFLLLVSLLPVSPTTLAQNEIVVNHYGVTYIFNSTSVIAQTSNESFSFSLLYNNLKQTYSVREVDIEQNRYIIYEYAPNILGFKTGVWANITFAFLKYSPLCKITFSVSNVGNRTRGQGFPFVLSFDKNLKQKGPRLKLNKLFFDFGDAVQRANKTGRFSVNAFSNKISFEVLSDEEIDPTLGSNSGTAINQVVQYSYATVPAVFGNGINGSLTISSNTAWTKAGNYYNFTSLTINSGVTLTVSSGVKIRVSGALTVYGTISANGKGGAGGSSSSSGANGANGPATDAVGGSGGSATIGSTTKAGGSYGGGGGATYYTGSAYLGGTGGSYGGGGASAISSSYGAYGGAGGGIITIYAHGINIASGAVITASGYNGSCSSGATNYAAAGGGGGRIYIYAGSGGYSNSGTLKATGGNAVGSGGAYAAGGGGGGYIKVTAPTSVTIGTTNVAGGSAVGYVDSSYGLAYSAGAGAAGSTATAIDSTLADTSGSGSSTTTYAYYWSTSSSNTTWRWDFSYSFPSGAGSRSLSVTFPKGQAIINVTSVSTGTALTTSQFSVSVYNTTHYLLTIPDSTISSYGSSYKLFTSSVNYVYQVLKDGSYYSPSSTLNFNIQIKDASGNPIANQKISAFITDANFATIYASGSALSSTNGWYNGSFTVPSTDGTYYLRANTTGGVFYLTFKVSKIKVVSWYTPKTRKDVGSSPIVASGTAQFTVDSSNVPSGTIYINGSAVSISNGAFSWSYSSSVVKNYSIYTTGVSGDKVTTLDQTYSGWVVFDKVNVTSFTFSVHRLNVSQALPSLTANLVYEYDNTPFVGSYTLNDTSHSTVGKYWYKIASISDSKYGLTVFDQKVFDYLIFDKWNLTLSAVNTRVPVNSNATIYVTGKSLYDGTAWQGKATLNINSKQPVGTYTFFVKNITDNLFNVTSFINNSITIKFDALKVNGLKFNGFDAYGNAQFSISNVTYATDNTLASGYTIMANGQKFSVSNFSLPSNGIVFVSANSSFPTLKNVTWNLYSGANALGSYRIASLNNKTLSLSIVQTSIVLVTTQDTVQIWGLNNLPYAVTFDGKVGVSPTNYTYDASSKILTLYVPHTIVVVYQTSGALSQPVGGGGGAIVPSTNLVLESTFKYSRKVFVNSTIFVESVFEAKNPFSSPVYSATVIIKGIGYKIVALNTTYLKFDEDASKNQTNVYVFGLKPNEVLEISAYSPFFVSGNPYEATFDFLGYALTYGQLFAFAIALIIAFASLKVSRNGLVALALFVGAYATLCVLYFKVDPTFMAIPANPNAPLQAINSTITSTTTKVAPFQNDVIIFAVLIGALIVYLTYFRKK